MQVIVQGASVERMQALVASHGGQVAKTFPHLNALVARIPASAAAPLQASGLLIAPDAVVQSAAVASAAQPAHAANATVNKDSYPSVVTGASELHTRGITGKGVTVAIIDSGMPALEQRWERLGDNTLRYEVMNGNTNWRLVYKDLVTTRRNIRNSEDPYGHGTHVMASIADGRPIPGGAKFGVAPDVNLVVVRALDESGEAPYSRIMEAINWVIAHKDFYNIRVLNLSIQATVHGPYWHDPLAQAAMAAWDAGITVVVSGGNTGSAPATITVPGNTPYVITVGALKPGMYTLSGNDELAYYSSAGPTESKFVKPDVLIAGSRVIAPMPSDSVLASHAGLVRESVRLELPGIDSQDNLTYFYLSGTSMAAAEVTGVVALLLQDEPNLTNDQIKFRLTNTAQMATDGNGNAVYSIWQQGAGKVNVVAAIDGTSTAEANAGMDLTLDRDHENGVHYLGTTSYDEAARTFSFENLSPDGSGGSGAGGATYNSWAGTYNSWAGTYNSWAGTYNSWAGSTSVWSGSYNSWAGTAITEE